MPVKLEELVRPKQAGASWDKLGRAGNGYGEGTVGIEDPSGMIYCWRPYWNPTETALLETLLVWPPPRNQLNTQMQNTYTYTYINIFTIDQNHANGIGHPSQL